MGGCEEGPKDVAGFQSSNAIFSAGMSLAFCGTKMVADLCRAMIMQDVRAPDCSEPRRHLAMPISTLKDLPINSAAPIL